MNYTFDLCMHEFTPEQGNRMVCALLNYRGRLVPRNDLDLSPKTMMISSGHLSGPFDPDFAIYTLANQSTSSSIPWTVSTPAQDLATLPYVDVQLMIRSSILEGQWIQTSLQTTEHPAQRIWYLPPATATNNFFQLKAILQ